MAKTTYRQSTVEHVRMVMTITKSQKRIHPRIPPVTRRIVVEEDPELHACGLGDEVQCFEYERITATEYLERRGKKGKEMVVGGVIKYGYSPMFVIDGKKIIVGNEVLIEFRDGSRHSNEEVAIHGQQIEFWPSTSFIAQLA